MVLALCLIKPAAEAKRSISSFGPCRYRMSSAAITLSCVGNDCVMFFIKPLCRDVSLRISIIDILCSARRFSCATVFPTMLLRPPTLKASTLLFSLYSSTSFSNVFSRRSSPSFSLVFTSNLLSGSITAMPTARQIMPTGKNEKNESPSYDAARSVSSITRLGGVPMSVSIPPILLANANGISNRDALFLLSIAIDTIIGIISATVPVLLTNAPISAVTITTSRNIAVSLLPANCIILPLAALASPVCNMAPPTTNRPTIITTT